MAQKRKMEAQRVKEEEAAKKQKEKERVLNELLGGGKLFKKKSSDYKVPEKFFKQIQILENFVDGSSEQQSGYSLSDRGDIHGIYNDNPLKSQTTQKMANNSKQTLLEKTSNIAEDYKLKVSEELSLIQDDESVDLRRKKSTDIQNISKKLE